MKDLARELRRPVRCYAASLHMVRGENPRNPTKKLNLGYARIFEEIALYPGRTQAAAKWSDLTGTARPEAPWKDGLPRMIFVSDMGDALSSSVPFEFLLKEIVEVAASSNGSRHLWLWLSKRPARMLKFDRWLEARGIPWPDNLVAMTSVMDRKMEPGIKALKKIRAKAKGLSVEPLVEAVTLDLEGIDWVIVGGESGTSALPFHLDWARDIQKQCSESATAFFMKQLGRFPVECGIGLLLDDKHGGDWSEWPEDLRVREFPAKFRV
ncbi:MAG: DUF5131 family protein [Luteolibacter sp.]